MPHRSAPRPAALLRALAAAVALPALPLGAQTALPAAAELRAAPNAAPIATLRARTPVVAGTSRDGYTQVTVSGYVSASLLAAGRPPFNWTVKAPSGALLRAAGTPGAAVLAELRDGAGLAQMSREGEWVRVSRTGWVRSDALARGTRTAEAAPSVAAAPPPARPARTAAADSSEAYAAFADPDAPDGSTVSAGAALAPVRETPLTAQPGGRQVATLGAGAVVTPLVRNDGWVRVRMEGWVHESDLAPASAAGATPLAAAELRANPEGTRGKVVHWDVEFLALQSADPLRHDLTPDEPYLLARGPAGENAIVYLAVPPALLDAARALPPLTAITVTARVRNGRSEPIGVPVLELQSLVRSKKK
ncbi:MAG TPA: hypothetical protein VKA84_17505 [Gemmatimonadaceae bacterium]|nr:hypothetical protein [Gemmatimonadaceae bacterium]